MMENEDHILERSIGERIKTLRAESGLTLDRLASESGVSRAMISRIERGEASPTASLLARICAAFGLSLSGFFAENEETVSPLVRKRDQQLWKDPETGYVRRAISPPRVGSDVDIVEVEFPAGARRFSAACGKPGHDAICLAFRRRAGNDERRKRSPAGAGRLPFHAGRRRARLPQSFRKTCPLCRCAGSKTALISPQEFL